jgi:hypothetical protein
MTEEDYVIPSIRMDQTMSVLSVAVITTINTFLHPEDTEEEKANMSWICLAIFLHQLLAPTKYPSKAIGILEAIIAELKDLPDAHAP